ncbi:class II fructose-bisphosphate aldolase [Cohaesibacter sp. CAU 1516]|uniref:class II fructose-bisphosphate aldolase n=1 Tax=Cohaesibacter sp. CAU 1516 TaxID=2576038 RepID=UPI0010FEC99B|nr:class II fructose-bisphosphate aldolase [Cohaesibacter sp. CAU 1516]TLP47006.1 class II fructose-bisphosphate aldolase [Cohaesibacter sp. CAU 1516]
MAYISGKTLLDRAWKEGYAIGAFSVHNAETTRAILKGAEEEKAPILVMIGQKVINTMGLAEMKAMVDAFMANHTVPVAIHIDHSRQFEQTMAAARVGFHSLMFDGSGYDFEDNVRITKAVADVAHALGIGCEGEIGKIGGVEDDIDVDEADAMITSVEEAQEFTNRTGLDYLAISMGTAHGIYTSEPKLAFDRIREIKEIVQKPLVMHGGSGVPDDQVQRAISLGIAKVNVDTELRQSFTLGVQDYWKDNPTDFVLADSLGAGEVAMKEKVKEKIRLFGSSGKASDF